MHKKKPWIWFAVVFAATLACGMPGFSAPLPVDTLDSNSLSTVVAETANAAGLETAAAATNTPLPSPTEIPTSTATATPTPPISSEGTSLSKQSDGSYLFTDHQGGYSVNIPPGWLAIRINQQEFINVWTLPIASDPKIQKFLSQVQNFDPKIYRLIGIDADANDLQTGYIANLLITWHRNDTMTIAQDIAQAKTDLPKSSRGLKVTYADVGYTSTNIPVGIVETSQSGTTLSGQNVSVYQKVLVLKLKSGSLSFTLSTVSQLRDGFVPGFDVMTDQIKMLP